MVENVGNLVCPAEFRIGEDARVMVSSVTEGEDKPLKYPLMFRACELVLINKIDLLEHLDFDLDRFLHHLDAVNPACERMLVSARTGEGVDAFRDWLAAHGRDARRAPRRDRGARRGPRRRAAWPRATDANAAFFAAEADARPPVPPHGRAVRARRAAGRLRRARPPRARTPATSPSSSSTR